MSLAAIVSKVVNLPLKPVGLEIRHATLDHPKPPKFDKKPYLWLIRQNISTVLDIGANTGQFAEHIHRILPEAQIISFEPLADCYDELVKNGRKLGRFTAYNYALSDEEGNTSIYRSEFSPSSSLLPMGDLHKAAFPHTRGGTVETVSTRRLDDMQDLGITYPLLVKIDVQGFEDHVIAGGSATIGRAAVLIVETSFQTLYDHQPLFDDVYRQLRELGFAYHGNWFQDNDARDGAALQSDSIFVKRVSLT